MTVLERNLAVITAKAPHIAEILRKTSSGTAYKDVVVAKTGLSVPVFATGQALHSLYDPARESERALPAESGFMLFGGLGSGIQISAFLQKYPHSVCAVTEADYPSLKQLLSLIDYTDILSDSRVFLLPPCTDSAFIAALTETYLPALHGTFGCYLLRAWSGYFKDAADHLSTCIETGLEKIKADFSVQAHFGKIWVRNIFLNLQLASCITPQYPNIDTARTAFIVGAGPSLDSCLDKFAQQRQRYTLFCTDTALPVLLAHGIIPEFFIALDPQSISYLHTCGIIPRSITGVFDLSAQKTVSRCFYENGNPLFFTAGNHPLVQTAAAFSSFPQLNTVSGTVAVAAYHAAQSLGFRRIECTGMDFAYTGGQAYARGTYLTALYTNAASRILPEEDAFIRLMFRTPVYHEEINGKYTYKSSLLDSYRTAFEAEKKLFSPWNPAEFRQFPYKQFIKALQQRIAACDRDVLMGFFPFLAWYTVHGNANFDGMELVSEVISGYTKP